MRISDWSSDVCSSDLQRSASRRWVREDGGTLYAWPGRNCEWEIHAHRQALAIPPGLRRQASGGRKRLRLRLGDAGRRSAHAVGTLRSEEHTSELQSLMRISYAVFCLKKKNKRQH